MRASIERVRPAAPAGKRAVLVHQPRATPPHDGERAAKIIQDVLGIESDNAANYCFPKTWPADREQRARIIGEWLRAEAR